MPFKQLLKKGYSKPQAKAIMAKEGTKKKAYKSKGKIRGFASLG